ncbi:MAG TPA: hypothetical protein PLZ62_01830 [bacterium]|nr:hypothetical protein [bacterium]
MTKKVPYILLVLATLVLAFFPTRSVLASKLDISHGIMPDNFLYQLDLQFEQLELDFYGDNSQKLADLHYQYSKERLSEIDYLADQDNITLDKAISINDNYQQNITEYTKIISDTSNNTSDVKQIVPQIQNLQDAQTQVVEKINAKSVNEEVKIIVKSSIKESQDNLIKALATASKPIVEQQINNQTANPDSSSIDNQEIIETTKKVDNTLNNLQDVKNSLKEEIKNDEENLKQKKESQSIVSDNPSQSNNATNSNNTIETSDSSLNSDQADADNSENSEDASTIAQSEDNPASTTDTSSTDESSSPATAWYYSLSCDYLSATPGKDPVCGDDLIPVSSLPADSSFFAKYQYIDGKYVQNIETMADKSTNDAASEIVNIIDNIEKNNSISDDMITDQNPESSGNPEDNPIENQDEQITY